MPIARPYVIALAVALFAGVGWYATGGSRSAGNSGSAPAVKAVRPAPKGKSTKAAQGSRRAGVAVARTGRAAARRATVRRAQDAGVPRRVLAAVARGRTVVLFFFQPGAADDDATAAAVRGLRGATVFRVPIARVAAYRSVISGAGVSQAPAVVIVNRRGARLVEGYVDRQSLAQLVADAS